MTAPEQPEALWARFASRLESLGARLAGEEDLRSLAGRAGIWDDDVPASAKSLQLRPVSDVWEAEVGLTLAECAIAESGSLLLAAGPGRRRMSSLAPDLHVCFVPEEAIVATLEEGLARLGDRTSVLVTGSSRTADIEGVLVRGVHGPREVWVCRF
jgi:L-lactate utilization protein LutC